MALGVTHRCDAIPRADRCTFAAEIFKRCPHGYGYWVCTDHRYEANPDCLTDHR